MSLTIDIASTTGIGSTSDTVPTLDSRTFSSTQLLRTAKLFARDPSLPTLLDATSSERQWLELARTPNLQVWLILWPTGTSTGWHDHGVASGAFTVVDGIIDEHNWQGLHTPDGGHENRSRLRTGRGRAFGRTYIHDVRNTGPQPALTVHAYSPELVAMTRYDVVDGRLQQLGVDREGGAW